MEKLRWSEDKPDKSGLWAYCANKSPDKLSIEGICYGPNTAIKGDYLFCYLGPIPKIGPPLTYRQPKNESDVGKAVEYLKAETKYAPYTVIEKWVKDYKIIGYKTAYGKSEYLVRPPIYGSDFWATPDRVRILE